MLILSKFNKNLNIEIIIILYYIIKKNQSKDGCVIFQRVKYKINGIIVGAGRVGYNLAKKMQTEHDITVIEKDHDRFVRASEDLSCYVVHGSAANTSTLEKANIQSADFFVAVTGNDEVNLLSSVYAKEHGVSIISSKLNNPDHSSIFEKLGIGFINPERSVVRFITRMIIRPSAQSLVTLGKGGAEILEFTVQNEELDGKKISEIENDSPYFKIVSKFVNDEDDAIIPNPETIIEVDDSVSVIVKNEYQKQVQHLCTNE